MIVICGLASRHNVTQNLGVLSSNGRPQGKERRYKPLGLQEMQNGHRSRLSYSETIKETNKTLREA